MFFLCYLVIYIMIRINMNLDENDILGKEKEKK